MALKLKTLRDAIEHRGTKLAIYGESSAGKTTQIAALLAYLGDDDKVLIITAEHGLLTLAQEQLGILDDPRIDVAEVEKLSEAREAVTIAATRSNGYTWVIVDSVSNIASRELRAIQGKNVGTYDPRSGHAEVKMRIPGILWGLVDIAHLGVLFIFQEDREERNEGTTKNPDNVLHYSPQVPNKGLKQEMPYIFDAVLRLEVMGDKSRRFRTAKTRTIMAKDRSGTLDEFEPADVGAVVAKIRGGVPAVRPTLLEEDPPPDDVDHIA